MTAFKVGDRVVIKSQALGLNIPIGKVATVIQEAPEDATNFYRYKVRYGTLTAWVTDSEIAAYISPDKEEIVHWGADGVDGVTEATPIDLPTIKFIYGQWKTILDIEGQTDEVAANVFSGYISGLMQGLKGDFDG